MKKEECKPGMRVVVNLPVMEGVVYDTPAADRIRSLRVQVDDGGIIWVNPEYLSRVTPVEPDDVGYVYDSPQTGHKYVRIGWCSHSAHWYRISGSVDTPLKLWAAWKEIA